MPISWYGQKPAPGAFLPSPAAPEVLGRPRREAAKQQRRIGSRCRHLSSLRGLEIRPGAPKVRRVCGGGGTPLREGSRPTAGPCTALGCPLSPPLYRWRSLPTAGVGGAEKQRNCGRVTPLARRPAARRAPPST
ncbi:hypothetical protein NDU88_005467 [Pleurodeles waltl]|uniref:Uncharacterized protein n=1 Tax=Pleurodeles waltl TaxID=8319 RepID=A0AAV7QIX7_PLEWA|nr:hypothetical protein NDU88_005467 [Pleurodeles waltl]